jgi:putative ABC transport system permease protein
VNSGARTSVQQAISNYRPGEEGSKKNPFRLNPAWFNWASRPLLLSFRNTFRKKGRLMLTIFTLTVAGAVFIAVFNVSDSLSDMMDKLMAHFMGDVNVTMRQSYKINKVLGDLEELPGVVHIEGWGGAPGELVDSEDNYISRIYISAPPANTALVEPDIFTGRWLLPGEENALVISDTIYTIYPDLKPGDSINIKIPGRSARSYTIVGIFRFISMLGDIISYANYDFISQQTHTPDGSASYRIITSNHDRESVSEMARMIDETLTDHNYSIQSVQSGTILRESATQSINVLIVFLLIMALLTAIVGSIGLTGTMSINVLERTREIGVMRTIGAVDSVIMRSVILEGLVIGIITWVLAIAVSFPISSFLLTIVVGSYTQRDLVMAGGCVGAFRFGEHSSGPKCGPPHDQRSIGLRVTKKG